MRPEGNLIFSFKKASPLIKLFFSLVFCSRAFSLIYVLTIAGTFNSYIRLKARELKTKFNQLKKNSKQNTVYPLNPQYSDLMFVVTVNCSFEAMRKLFAVQPLTKGLYIFGILRACPLFHSFPKGQCLGIGKRSEQHCFLFPLPELRQVHLLQQIAEK